MPDALIENSSTPEPRVFLILNLFFFVCAFLLLYFFLKEFNFSSGYRFIFTGMMALHPALTPAVAWIPGRVDTILFIIVIGSIWAFLRFLKTQNKKWAVLHVFLFLLGMFTKETSIVIPIISLLLINFLSDESKTTETWSWNKAINLSFLSSEIITQFKWIKKHSPILLGWIGSLIFWYILRKNALSDDPLGIMSTLFQISTSWKEFIILGGITYLPFNLQVFLEVTSPFILFALPGFLLFLAIPTLLKTDFKNAFFGFLWIFLFVFPTTLSDFLNYHRMFIPLVGLAFILKPLDLQWKHKKKRWIVIGLLATLFLWQNIQFQKAFTHRVHFWGNASQYSPNSAFANNGLAWSYHLDQEQDSALKYYQRVIDLRPDRENVRMGMALIHEDRKEFKLADSLLNAEFIATKDSAQVYFYIGQIILDRGDTSNAISPLNRGIPSMLSSRNSRMYYDTLAIEIKQQLDLP
jgi:hypothetical protein